MTFGGPALAAIDAAFAEPVVYTGAGLTGAAISVIWSDSPGPPFQGAGNTVRTITAEVRKEKLPQRPGKGNTLVRKGVTWRVTQTVDRDDVEAWELTIEKVSG